MELQAVLEALKNTDPKLPLIVRTDSQYVHDGANKRTLVRKNADLWVEYENLKRDRRVKVVWIPGHAGDPMNERADALAKEQALLGAQNLRQNIPEPA